MCISRLAGPTFTVACRRLSRQLEADGGTRCGRRVPILFVDTGRQRTGSTADRACLDPSQVPPLVIDGQRYEFKSFDGNPASGDAQDAVRILQAFHQA